MGSAWIDLLKQSGESLAGRIAYLEMRPIDGLEVGAAALGPLWVRGGFPDSFLATNDRTSQRWRQDFLRTYLERDIRLLGPRIPAETLRRFWTMLATTRPAYSTQPSSPPRSASTVRPSRPILICSSISCWCAGWSLAPQCRQAPGQVPRVYVRDSGITHTLLGLATQEDMRGHPVAGASWEEFVIETLTAAAPAGTLSNFYRTAADAEIDFATNAAGPAPLGHRNQA
ncbi:ATP-binding protein [Mesorhizobium waimense]|uniref:ATP-binding protein n=1 Tax=Mesorhizobium waimense TaxID=1300307 RepID=A0A3A5K5F4_9HYPH|nr:ATP-binding protein [Mesorhizobium waimense]